MLTYRDRREQLRAPIKALVREELYREDVIAHAIDIGEQGLRYVKAAGAPVRESNEVLLEFCLPDDPAPIKVLGCVANERVAAGVRSTSVTFAFMPEADQARVREYVKQNA